MPDPTPTAPPAPAAPAAPAAAAPSPAAPPAPAPAAGAVAPAPAPAAEVKYDLKLPEHSALDPAVLEKTAAFARERKLSPDDAQKTLEFFAGEAKSAADRAASVAVETYQKAHDKGGAEWVRQHDAWRTEALNDPALGAGDQAKLDANVKLAQRALASLGVYEAIQFLEASGIGSHPAMLKAFVAIGNRMKEDDFVTAPAAPDTKDVKKVMYDHPSSQPAAV